jgi:hypothetical protein
MKPGKLVFLHIPKTAGTSLQGVIWKNYFPKSRFTVNAIRYPEKLETFDGKDKSKIKILTGHVPFGSHETFGQGEAEYFTLLRDPVDRTVSHYYQVIRTPTHHFAKEMAEKKYTLKELMESGKLLYVDNLQVRMISGDLRIPYGSVNENTLKKALENIENYFPVVGLQNQFDAMLLKLVDRYGWKFPWYRRQQVSTNRKKTTELDDATLEAVKKYNQYDQQLFDMVKKKLEKEYDPEFLKRVEKFQKKNNRLAGIVKAIPFFPAPRGD